MTDRGPDGPMTDRAPDRSMTGQNHGFSERTVATARAIVARYPQPRSALLPLFYLVQAEQGRITEEGLAFCAQIVGVTKAEAQAVETYYEMYEHEDPGDYVITVCRNFSCKVRGSFDVHARIAELTDGDERMAVKWMECLGNCEGAPVVQVNYNNYERVTLEQAEAIVDGCRRGEPPVTATGEVPPTFREVSWRLSGAADGEVLHTGAVRGAEADLVDYPEPPAERILDVDKPLGAPGVHDPGPEVGEVADIEPELTPDAAEQARREQEQIPTSEEQPIEEDASTAGEDEPDGDGEGA
jgi:NADH-quinone oxidoreductase subunit E